MNKQRRKELGNVFDKIAAWKSKADNVIDELKSEMEDYISQVQRHHDDEEEYYENMPESLQGSDKGTDAEQAVSDLDSAIDTLQRICDELDGFSYENEIEEALESIDNARGTE